MHARHLATQADPTSPNLKSRLFLPDEGNPDPGMWAPGNGQAEPAPYLIPGAGPHWRGARWRAVREPPKRNWAAEPNCALCTPRLRLPGRSLRFVSCNRRGLGPGPSGPRGCLPGVVRAERRGWSYRGDDGPAVRMLFFWGGEARRRPWLRQVCRGEARRPALLVASRFAVLVSWEWKPGKWMRRLPRASVPPAVGTVGI